MSTNHIAIGEAYYTAMGAKDITSLVKYIHPEIKFVGPFGESEGKEAFLKSAEGFMQAFKKLTIRTACGEGDQAMLVYDVECPSPIGNIRSAALMNFRNELICRIELFFDAHPFR